jgi:two-component system phosphate regulon response regulator OmpR
MATPIKIVVVEDHDDARHLLVRSIQKHGYDVFAADCAEALDDLLIDHTFDLVVLDLNLPTEDGISICKRLKSAHPYIYIVMVTARNSIEARISGYQAGADIYLTKPFSSEELLAAIANLAGRIQSQERNQIAYINVEQSTLIANRVVDLNKKELATLKALLEAPSRKLPFFRLIEVAGEEVNETSKAALDVRIARLRKKFIEAGIDAPAIKVNRTEGFQLLMDLAIKN